MRRGHVPVRTCLGCRERRPKQDLIRLAAGPDGVKMHACGGRGLYICPDASCLERALRKRDIAKSVGRHVTHLEIHNRIDGRPRRKGLDGTCPELVICVKSSGGGAVG